jgi:hypothetical protein
MPCKYTIAKSEKVDSGGCHPGETHIPCLPAKRYRIKRKLIRDQAGDVGPLAGPMGGPPLGGSSLGPMGSGALGPR